MDTLKEYKRKIEFELEIVEGCIKNNKIERDVYLKILADLNKIERGKNENSND